MASVCYECHACGHYSHKRRENDQGEPMCNKCTCTSFMVDWDEAGDFEAQDAYECDEEEAV